MAIPVWVSIHSRKEATLNVQKITNCTKLVFCYLVNAACIPISHPNPEPKLVIPICLYFPSSYRYSSGPPESPYNTYVNILEWTEHFLTLQVDFPSLPEIQMFLWSMLIGNWRAQAVLVMVSTVASLRIGLMLSLESVGLPHPLICMSRLNQVVFHSE